MNPVLWYKMVEFRCNNKNNWSEFLEFQKKVQINIIEAIKKLETFSPKTKGKIYSRAKEEVLFLVDIPIETKDTEPHLYFLPEQRMRGGPIPSHIEKPTMEDSKVWSSLATNFLESVGKIRVFCHPDFIDDCSRGFEGTNDIEGALTSALNQMRQV
jgi:hypothetical protein